MVFEGILVDILNSFLGDYIENLDREQLSLAVWSGNIELRELQTKESVLDDLNYPIRTKFGYLGKLRVEIPWKNLYTQPIHIIIEDVLLLAVPNDDAELDKEKTERRHWEQKQRQLKHLELVGGSESDGEEAKTKTPVKTKTTFTERLVAKLIGNLQVEVRNVHVRYEGSIGEKGESFCFGATLGSVQFKSTDDKFNIKTVDEVCHLLYKLLKLEYLAAYCSPSEKTLLSDLQSKDDILAKFQTIHETTKENPSPIQAFHVLEPVFFTSKVAINPKPEAPECAYSTPKLTIDCGLQAIKLRLSRRQYSGVLEFLETMEGLTSKSKYRAVTVPMPKHLIIKSNVRDWWTYAITAVLEVDVRPRLRQWSWSSIKEHRDLLRSYTALYSTKINSTTVSAGDEKQLEEMEKKLDVFNIVLARHQAQFEVNKSKKKVSWWGWLTGSSHGEDISDENDIRHRLKQAMTEEERNKLHAALGVAETVEQSADGSPAEYVATRLLWDLDQASVALVDDEGSAGGQQVASLKLTAFSGKFEQRPAADGIFLKTEVKDIIVLGMTPKGDEKEATVIAKPEEGTPSWLQMLYESNPVGGEFGVRLHLFVDPVQLVYDAETVNAIVKFFKPPEAIALRQLQAQALMALQALRESTVAAVKDILQNHRYTDFDVDLKAPYLIIPEYGRQVGHAACAVVDFGRIQLTSIAKGGEVNPDLASLEDLKEQSYEKYELKFKDLSIIFAEEGEDWQEARRDKDSPLQILHSIDCVLQLQNCLIRNHPLLPLGRVFGDLPTIKIDISEERFLNLMRMLLTIPLPDTSYSGDLEFSEKARDIVREYRDMKTVQTLFAMKQPEDEMGAMDVVIIEFGLKIQEISVSILNHESERPAIFKVAALNFDQTVSMTSANMEAKTTFNDLFVEFCSKDSNEPVKLIKSYRSDEASPDSPVFQLTYTSVSSLSPDFESKHHCTLSRVDVDFAGLEVLVDQKALLDIATLVDTLRKQVSEVVADSQNTGPRIMSSFFAPSPPSDKPADASDSKEQVKDMSTDLTAETADEGFVSQAKLIQFAMHAKGEIITVTLADSRGKFCRAVVQGLDVGFEQKQSSMTVETKLKGIALENPDEGAKWPLILRTKGQELLAVKAVIRTDSIEEQRKHGHFSQEIDATLGAVEFVFLNVFILDISRFAESLQGIVSRVTGAAQVATEKTKQAAVDIYEQAARLKVELDLKAPVVILPQNSRSLNALVFDLGNLRVANDVVTDSQLMVDTMNIEISKIVFDRVEDYSMKGPGQVFSIIKQPEPTKISLKRNLSYKQDPSIPEIEAEGSLPSFELNLSNVDYQVILDTFTQNFAEGQQETTAAAPPGHASHLPQPSLETVQEQEEPLSAAEGERGQFLGTPEAAALPGETPADPEGKVEQPQPRASIDRDPLHPKSSDEADSKEPAVARFKLALSLDKISAALNWKTQPRGRRGTMQQAGAGRRASYAPAEDRSLQMQAQMPEEKLAYFELTGFHVDAAVMPDMVITGHAVLQDLNLQDCRGAYEKRISRLIYVRSALSSDKKEQMQTDIQEKSSDSKTKLDPKKSSTAQTGPPLILLEAQKDEDGNQSVDVKVAPLEVAVIVDFFLEVAQFFTIKEDPNDPTKTTDRQAPLREKVKDKAAATPVKPAAVPNKGKKPVLPSPKSPEEAKNKVDRTIAINVVVDSPTILLVEDPKNLDSKVLLLSVDVKLNMGITEGGQSFQASAEKFRMFATHYKTRAASPQQIVSPADIALQFKSSVESGQHIGLTCTDLIIIITPSIVKLITTTLSGLNTSAAADEEPPEKPVGIFQHLWDAQPINEEEHWFLQPPPEDEPVPGDKILNALEKTEASTEKQLQQGDLFMFDLPSVMIVVEIGEVNRYFPAFLLECRAFGTMRDWTTRLQAKGILFLEMGSYNPKHDVWEPMIEPIDDGKEERPWELAVELVRNDISITDLRQAAKQGMNLQRRGSSFSGSTDSLASPAPGIQDVIPDTIGSDVMQESAALQLNLKATEPLQLTISKTAVDLMKTVVDSFTEAANKDLPLQEAQSTAPYILHNHLGIHVQIQVIAPLQYGAEENITADSDGMIQVKSGATREIYLNKSIRRFHKNVLHQSTSENELKMKLIVAGRTLDISLLKAERRFFFIQNAEDVQRPYRLIVDVVAETNYKAIHLQSSMTVTSYLLMPMELSGGFASVDHTGVVDPNQTVFMPIRSVQFDEKAVLSCRPAHSELYQASKKIPIGEILRMDAEEKTYILQCNPTKLGLDPTLYFIMFCRVQHVKYENTQKFTPNSVEYQVFLRAVITIANVLPYDIAVGYSDVHETRLSLEEKAALDPRIEDNHLAIEAGNSRPLYTVHPATSRLLIRLKDYMEYDWEGEVLISTLKEEFTPCILACRSTNTLNNQQSETVETVVVGIRTLKEDGTIFLTVYSPFWMINKTGLKLTYKKPYKDHLAAITQPLLFSTSHGKLTEKRKIAVKVEDGEWSKKFSPDAVGSNGVVSCQTGQRHYEMGLQIKHSATVITKIVILTPYFVLSNVSEQVAMEVRENNAAAEWILIPPKTTLPFWPMYNERKKEKDQSESNEKDKDKCPPNNMLVARIADTHEESAPFCYGILQNSLLRLRNKFGGIYVDTQVSESNAITTLQPFSPGRNTYRLMNLTAYPVFYRQLGEVQFDSVQGLSEKMFAWPIPSDERKLEWLLQDNYVQETDIEQDDSGTVSMGAEVIYWVSFYHENERIMLFTPDINLALRVQQSVDLEATSLELVASLESIGLSLVNNVAKHEVLYAGIVSGGPTWQQRKLTGSNHRFHNIKGRDAHQLEAAFQKYRSNVEADIHLDGLVNIEHSSMQVDFSQMMMTKPHNRQLQRIFEDGFWCRLKMSASQYQVHLKLQKMQIDNPNPLSQYPTMLVPVPLPESVGQKPLLEASLIIRQTAHSKVPQFKLLEALLQEVEVRADQGFINAIMSILQPEGESGFKARQKMLDNFHKQDGQELRRSLADTVQLSIGNETPLLFDHLVIHPLKIHVSFSLTGADNEQQSALNIQSEFVGLFVRTLGVTATEINDVQIKLATFERMHRSFTSQQIQQQLQTHYVSQLLKQFYTIALGLDVLGNPFGLVRGITGGVRDLFYEPYEGAIEGPEEFMAGLGSGIQSLLGKSVGGVLGTAEKLTGSVGRAIASVSFDEKFVRQRQRDKNRTPTDLPGALAQSGKSLGTGILHGITGIVTKPVEGAKQEGALGFFKGVGRGLLGVVVRPTAGVVDFATGSLEAVRRLTTSEVDPIRLRPTRHIGPDGVVRPYNLHQAEGAYLFRDIQKKELKEDEYVTHLVTSHERRYVLVLTTKRVLYLEKGEILQGRFAITWQYEWDLFLGPPSMSDKGIMFPVVEAQEKGLKGLLHMERKDKPRYVFVEDADSGEWFIRKVKAVMESMKEKS